MSHESPISTKGPADVAHGWMFIGLFINALLLGVMITQVYLYFIQYKKDKLWIKTFVAGLFVADIVNTFFVFIYLYRSLIIFYGEPEHLARADWLFATDPAITGLIASAVQLFFAWRVWILTKKWPFAILIASLAVSGGVAAILTAWNVGRTPQFVDFRNFKPTVIVWLSAEAIADVIITGILVWYLVSADQRKHKTGFQRSDFIIDRIIRVTVQTGMVTMLVASLDLLFYLIDPSGTHLLFNFPLAKLYSNSLMSSLNSRMGWKFGNTQGGSETTAVSDGGLNTKNLSTAVGSMKPQAEIISFGDGRHPELIVHVESHELRDIEKQAQEKSQGLGSESSVNKGFEDKWDADLA